MSENNRLATLFAQLGYDLFGVDSKNRQAAFNNSPAAKALARVKPLELLAFVVSVYGNKEKPMLEWSPCKDGKTPFAGWRWIGEFVVPAVQTMGGSAWNMQQRLQDCPDKVINELRQLVAVELRRVSRIAEEGESFPAGAVLA